MSRAIDALNDMQYVFHLKGGFFENLQGKLKYAERPKYVQIIARLETLDIYTKLRELKECKEKWVHLFSGAGKGIPRYRQAAHPDSRR